MIGRTAVGGKRKPKAERQHDMKVHQDPLFTFEFEEASAILRFRWTEKTANMTDDDFKRALTLYADFAEKHAARGLLVDVRNFKHRPGPDIGTWRDEKIVPRYVRAGVKKLAYVVGSNAPMSSGGDQKAPPKEPVATSYFGTMEEAEDWLKKS